LNPVEIAAVQAVMTALRDAEPGTGQRAPNCSFLMAPAAKVARRACTVHVEQADGHN
jgi:hypothetical protein